MNMMSDYKMKMLRRLTHVLLIVILSFSTEYAFSQFWQPTSGPEGLDVQEFEVVNNTGEVYAAGRGGIWYHTSNTGEDWSNLNFTNFSYSIELSQSGRIYVGASGYIYFTDDKGINWINNYLGYTPYEIFEANNGYIFAGASYLGFNKVVPYGGLNFSMIDGDFSIAGVKVGDFEEADSIGLFMGVDLGINDQFKGGAEVRLVNETSFSVNLSYLF